MILINLPEPGSSSFTTQCLVKRCATCPNMLAEKFTRGMIRSSAPVATDDTCRSIVDREQEIRLSDTAWTFKIALGAKRGGCRSPHCGSSKRRLKITWKRAKYWGQKRVCALHVADNTMIWWTMNIIAYSKPFPEATLQSCGWIHAYISIGYSPTHRKPPDIIMCRAVLGATPCFKTMLEGHVQEDSNTRQIYIPDLLWSYHLWALKSARGMIARTDGPIVGFDSPSNQETTTLPSTKCSGSVMRILTIPSSSLCITMYT
jgi:hypothetical protein